MLTHRFVILLATLLTLTLTIPAQNKTPAKSPDTRKPFVIRSTPQTVLWTSSPRERIMTSSII